MKIVFAAIVFFVCVVSHAATPAFTDFNQDQFWTTNNKVSLKPSGVTNFPAGPTYVFNGKTTFTSNVFFNVTSYSTNSATSTTTIDLAKDYRAFSTNNNTGFTNLASIEAAGTNIQTVNLFITNSSGSVKTVAMGPNFQNMNSDGNILYLTNLGHLLVFYYPPLGTNFYWKSR
jgi:hypothetical protein